MARFTEMQRRALEARASGETQAQTAERFGVSRSAIAMRVARARQRLGIGPVRAKRRKRIIRVVQLSTVRGGV